MSDPAFPVNHQRMADPEGLVGAIQGSELDAWLLSGHRKESELSRVLLPGSCLDQAEFGPAMWFRGAMPKDCYTMVFVTACPEDGHSFNFNSRHRDECMGFFAPGEALDATTPAGYRQSTLTIPESVFLGLVESRYQEFPQQLLKKGGSIFPAKAACRELVAMLDGLAETIHHTPEALASEAARQSLESELHEQFFDAIQRDRGNGAPAANPRMTRRYQRMKRVRDFIRENSHRRIRLEELCAVGGLSRRGIEYLFLDLLGVQASAYLRRTRLHGVRRELLAAGPSHGLVKQCAMNWGFRHLGRFAGEYRALFSESPSATLSRRS
jgi:AraC-like DNA-binding protein